MLAPGSPLLGRLHAKVYSGAPLAPSAIAQTASGFLQPTSRNGRDRFGGAAVFGISLWAVAVAPVIIEVALFVNWHRGFVAGLLLDWLIVCVVASIAACLAGRVV